jgi:hypothetical protein
VSGFWEAVRESRRRRLYRRLDKAREECADAEGRFKAACVSVSCAFEKARVIRLSGLAARLHRRVMNLQEEIDREYPNK